MIFLDLETYSDVPINPLVEYCTHPSAKVILACIAKDDDPITVLEGDAIVEKLTDWFARDAVLCAWNITFERTFLAARGLRTEISRWTDTMVRARQLGLPGQLKVCAKLPVLNIPQDKTTTKETLLIKRFCTPYKWLSEEFSGPQGGTKEQWAAFVDYCRRDVESLRLIQRYTEKYPTSVDHDAWVLDQRINYRGLPIDVASCRHAESETTRLVNEGNAQLQTITKLENPNSVMQLLPWLKEQGYKYDSLGKDILARSLSVNPGELSERGRRVLEIRLDTAKASVKKFASILGGISLDGRLRGCFNYYGAHTGRWSGRGAQPQNLPRLPANESSLAGLLAGDTMPDLSTLSSLVRSMICAAPGNKLVVSDLAAIENRILMWLADCAPGLAVYEKGLDPYLEFGSRFFHLAYESVSKAQRQQMKPAVLGCGFGLGPGQRRVLGNGEVAWTGLKAYALAMGVELTGIQCADMVRTFRESYPEVPALWSYLGDAFYHCTKNKKRQRVGPEGAALEFGAVADAIYIELPSGRRIYYMNPRAFRDESGRQQILFDGWRGHSWGTTSTWGGRITENVVQAIARDVLVEGMIGAEKMGMSVVGHSHDEIISEVSLTSKLGHKDLAAVMSRSLPWAPGLPLKAEGWEGERYAKG